MGRDREKSVAEKAGSERLEVGAGGGTRELLLSEDHPLARKSLGALGFETLAFQCQHPEQQFPVALTLSRLSGRGLLLGKRRESVEIGVRVKRNVVRNDRIVDPIVLLALPGETKTHQPHGGNGYDDENRVGRMCCSHEMISCAVNGAIFLCYIPLKCYS